MLTALSSDAIAALADQINRECVGGWEFYSLYPVQVEKKAKGLGNRLANFAGLDMADGLYNANMLVFKKD